MRSAQDADQDASKHDVGSMSDHHQQTLALYGMTPATWLQTGLSSPFGALVCLPAPSITLNIKRWCLHSLCWPPHGLWQRRTAHLNGNAGQSAKLCVNLTGSPANTTGADSKEAADSEAADSNKDADSEAAGSNEDGGSQDADSDNADSDVSIVNYGANDDGLNTCMWPGCGKRGRH